MLRRALAVRRALAAVVVAVAVTACGGADDASPPPTAVDAATAPAGAVAVAPSLDFTAHVLGGGELAGASLAGQAVMLWFWAPT